MPRRSRSLPRTLTPHANNPKLAVEVLEDRAVPAVFTVNTTADTIDVNPGDGFALDTSGKTSLRAAVMEANALSGADTIQLPAGTYALSITGFGEANAATGDLDVKDALTILGGGASSTTIDAANLGDRIFDILSGPPGSPTVVKIDGVTLAHGKAASSGSPTLEDYGGGLRMDFITDVTITNSVFLGNAAPHTAVNGSFGEGGAIANNGKLTITGTTFDSNSSTNDGGAIYVGGSNAVTVIKNSTFVNNVASSGGAIKNHETMTIDNSTFANNSGGKPGSGGQGGAIDNNGGGNLTVTNSTFTGNSSEYGGAIINYQTLKVLNSTFAGNTATYGGGLRVGLSDAKTTLENTIVANNAATTGPDVNGTVTSLGHNLVGDTTAGSGWNTNLGDLLNVDPKLGSLADNGGPTKTMALLSGSPAIDAANTADAPATDQRGVSRPQGGAADIGAFEAPGNTAPVANDQSQTTNEDTKLTGTVTATDADGDALTFALVQGPAHGSLTFNANGTYTYTPARNYNGSDSFTFKANDGAADSNVATVSITINPVNDAPFPSPIVQNVTTAEDTPLSGQVKAIDVDGDTLTFALVQGPTHGSLTFNADGTYIYTPGANYNGSDAFVFRASDPGGLVSNPGGVSITVTPVNDAPVAVNDSYTVDEDGTLSISGSTVTRLRMVSDAGDFVGQGLTYDFNPSSATFSARQNFDNGVSLSVDPPALGEFWFLDFAAANNAVLTPGTYLDAQRFSFQAAGHPGLDVSGDGRGSNTLTGQFTVYDVGFSGSTVTNFAASFEQHSEGNDPALVGWVMYNSTFGAGGGVLANDTDVEGDLLLGATLVSGPAHGTLDFHGDGTFTYTPDANFNGTDTFTYKTNDGRADSNVATVTITVNPVNDPPVAVDDSATTDEDTAATISVLTNDTDVDNDSLSVSSVTQGANGSVTNNGNGTVTYTPKANFNGTDSFTYTIDDGHGGTATATVRVTVNAVNDAPVAANDSFTTDEDTALTVSSPGVLSNDSDVDSPVLTAVLVKGPAHGSVVLNSDGSFTYTPNANYNGSDTFTYQASDGAITSNVATVSITVNPVNDPPVAADDSFTTNEDTVLSGNVLTNDSDVDGDALSASVATGPSYGALALNADGSFTYTPGADYNGADSFTYTVSDGNGGTATATVNITVNPVNDPPVAADDSFSTDEDTVLNVTAPGVLANDSDVDSTVLTAGVVTGPAHGTLTFNANGSFTYTPNANYNGSDAFTYRVSDGQLQSATATVHITVNPVNDAPVAVDDLYTTTEGAQLAVAGPGVLGNDSDVDGDSLKASLVTGPGHGTLQLNADGSFVYTPAAGFSGTDSFTYSAGDGSLGDPATVTIKVNPAPATEGHITGGGVTGAGSFKVNVQSRESRGQFLFSGTVSYQDAAMGINLQSASIDYVRVDSDGRGAQISGTATVNGVSGYSFTIFLADNGEPGRQDTFRIVITGPQEFLYNSADYDPSGLLDSGNLQVHKK